MDKLWKLHLILLWQRELSPEHWNKAAYVILMNIGEYCEDSEVAWKKFGWLLRRITITQAFEASKIMRWARATLLPEDGEPLADSLATALGAWELEHARTVDLFWDDTASIDAWRVSEDD